MYVGLSRQLEGGVNVVVRGRLTILVFTLYVEVISRVVAKGKARMVEDVQVDNREVGSSDNKR